MRPQKTGAWIYAAVFSAFATPTNTTAATELTYSWGHPSPQGNVVYAIAFANDTQGWAVGGSGFVLRTVDGGEHWDLAHGPLQIAPDLYDIVVTDTGALIACGSGDALFRSTDQGATWQSPPHPATPDLRDLFLLPSGAISAAGINGDVLFSTDDGMSWEEIGPSAGTIRHQYWKNDLDGFVVGLNVSHRTTNGGGSWTPFLATAAFGYNEIYFTDSMHGYVNEDFVVWRTTDGGVSWDDEFNFTDPLYRFRTLTLSPTHWLLGLLIEGGQLWETTDAGASWTQVYAQGGMGFPCLVQAPSGRIFFGSDLGDILWSDDLGRTVHNATTNLGGDAENGIILGLFRRPDGVTFAANQPTMGETPAWLRSDDGGTTWFIPDAVPGLYWAHVGGFFDNQNGVVAYNENIRATFDGGVTWQTATPLPTPHRVTGFAFPASDRFFASSYRTSGGGSVFRSTNGGLSWSPVDGGLPSVRFLAIEFPTPMIGYAVGQTEAQSPRLFKTIDGGETWQQLAPTGITAPITAMTWFDALQGIVSQHTSVPGIRRTSDGGLTWTEVAPVSASRITRRSASSAAAVLSFGRSILLTSDAGLSWELVEPPLRLGLPDTAEILGAVAPTSNGWIIGAGGNKILVATEQLPTDVPNADQAADLQATRPRAFATPNPSRSGVDVHFELQTAGLIQVRIHDAQGRRIASLLERALPEGNHRVSWSGNDDAGQEVAAGIYFARIDGMGHSATCKITISR